MDHFIPPFDFHTVFVEPWSGEAPLFTWIVVMGFFITATCGLVGNYLILRRMALVGDAISHSILPGIVVAFLLSHSRGTVPMFLGALSAGLLTVIIIELIHRNSRIKQDAAIGIAFSTLFSIGVILISLYAGKVDLDQECVLYGEIGFVAMEPPVHFLHWSLGPAPVVRMASMFLLTGILIILFYKELLVSSFDAGLASMLGLKPGWFHYGLMALLSLVVVSAFESAGAILVIAMLILPGATASLLTRNLPAIHGLTLLHALISSLLGAHLGQWLDCSIAGAMVVMGAMLFVCAWIFNPYDGWIVRLWRMREGGGLKRPRLDEPATSVPSEIPVVTPRK